MNNTNQLIMTAEDVAAKFGIAVSTLKCNFNRTKETIEKKYGVILSKSGRGKDCFYIIENFEHSDPSRAVTLYQSMENNLVSAPIAAKLMDLHFLVFIGIVSSPQRAFRGSYLDLLKYIDIDISPTVEDIEKIREILRNLAENNFIMYVEDKTDPMYFMAAILRKTENEMRLELDAIRLFQKLVSGTRKSWIPLMKTYLALNFLDQPCTINNLIEATGLSEYKVRDSLSILSANNIIVKDKQVLYDKITKEFYCLGTQIDINAFGI